MLSKCDIRLAKEYGILSKLEEQVLILKNKQCAAHNFIYFAHILEAKASACPEFAALMAYAATL